MTRQFPSASELPDAPQYPIAEVVSTPSAGVPVRLEARQQEKHGNVYLLIGDVRIDYKNYTLTADKVSYNDETKDAEAYGHVRLQGGRNDELILSDYGKLNFELETGRFENVTGSIGRQPTAGRRKAVYTTSNPFLFTGRVVIKEGPERYRIIDGTMTSCQLPDPDWRIHSSLIRVNYGEAKANNSYFTLLKVPILYLPYATHPVDTGARQSGLLLPVVGTSSTKGTIVGDSIYLVINRSTDATFGTQYFSKRGWSPSGDFRYRGRGEDFVNARFTALFDRGLAPDYLNQGGQDILFSGRRDFDLDEHNRVVVTGEYLSSYVYRNAFAESFALAVASQVTSSAFLTNNEDGRSASFRFDRYQNFEGITQVGNGYETPQIRISHLPSLDFDTVERPLSGTTLRWSLDTSAAGLSRSEPGYKTGETGRFDLYPHLSLPLHLDGWTFRPEVGARETFYTQSQIPTSSTPLVGNGSVNRADLEASFELRPPSLVRDFKAPALERIFGSDFRHTIEPELEYRFVAGVNNFSSIPRFDTNDVESDTNELEYSLTQRLFFKHLHPKPCRSGELPTPVNGIINVPAAYTECGGDGDAWITWKLAAKYFFDPYFGGAASPFRRNVLISTLDFTGVAFLNGPRNTSPVISRFKVRTSDHSDLEWDADYDFKTKRMDASNIYADYRKAGIFGSVGYSTLQALNASFTSDLASQVTKYNLLRLLVGYGDPTKRGLSVGANAGYDFVQNALQYGGIQSSYNWDCCGLSVEYRRLALGSVRNENQYSFNFTLAGVGAAGNLKHSERIF
ncbi:MAG TPA: LPS assembly protein LptD [Acidobacteriaceae bacterium]|nr:LPS assembly protein LptD [Acidobacteriaceae bacterium]